MGERRARASTPAEDCDESIGGGGGDDVTLVRAAAPCCELVGDGGLGEGVLRAGVLAEVEAEVEVRARLAASA